MCFCVWHYSLCESHPLTAGTELSLIQLCLLSCLLAAPAPWCSSVMAFPSCFFFVCLWPRSGFLGLPFLALSLFFPPCLVAAWAPDNSTCLFSFLFFFLSWSQLFIHLANSFCYQPALPSYCVGDTEGDKTWALLSRDSRSGGRDRKAFKGVLGQSLGLRPVTDRLGMREGDEAVLQQGAVPRPSQLCRFPDGAH